MLDEFLFFFINIHHLNFASLPTCGFVTQLLVLSLYLEETYINLNDVFTGNFPRF